MASKKALICAAVRRHIADALAELNVSSGELKYTSNEINRIQVYVTSRMVDQDYNWLELCDLFAWRKRAIQ